MSGGGESFREGKNYLALPSLANFSSTPLSRHTTELEEWIDEYSELLPPLQNFILPGGGETASQIHICRSVCRRAERSVTPLCAAGDCDVEAQKYINRLSDFLFTIGRLAARIDGKEETIYTRPTADGYKPPPADGAWKKSNLKKKEK